MNNIGNNKVGSITSNYNKDITKYPSRVPSYSNSNNITKSKQAWETETYQSYNLYNKENKSKEESLSEDKKISTINNNDYKSMLNKDSNVKLPFINNSNNNFKVTTPIQIKTNTSNSLILESKQVGLDNLGNTCFMNTSLQCLLHTEPFMRRFFNEKDKILSGDIRSTVISKSIYNLAMDIIQKSEGSRVSVSPSEFKSIFGSAHRSFLGYNQHDTQEFLRLLLEDISKELNRIINIPKYRELDTRINNKVKLNNDYDNLIKAREDSIVTDTFTSQIVNIFTCLDCNYETYSFEKYIDIPLLLDESSGTTISKLLDGFFAGDKIKFESPCENQICKKKSYHSKFIKFGFTPEILMLSIQRNNGRIRRKNTSNISFEEKIDLAKYVDRECCSNSTKYNLYGISNHSGSLDFGHYFAYVKTRDVWYEFNDSYVSKCYSPNNNTSNVYVLFYRRDDV